MNNFLESLKLKSDKLKCCFVITQKYNRNYRSYVKEYVDNIQRFYPDSFTIIVDNNSLNVSDIRDKLISYNNLIILDNDSESKYELGGYIHGLKWLMQTNMISKFDYFIFTQDTLILTKKYDMNILRQQNVKACFMVEFDHNNSSMGRTGYLEQEKKQVLEPLGLYNELEHITLCWGCNFICTIGKIDQLYHYVKNIVLTEKRDSEASERYMARIIYELNEHRNFNIDGFLGEYMSRTGNSPDLEYDRPVYFQKKHQGKQNSTPEYTYMCVNNIYERCVDLSRSINSYIYITKTDFYMAIVSFNPDYTVNKYADEWLYLINSIYYPNCAYYSFFVNTYNQLLSNTSVTRINEHVVQLFTTFSRGSVHGFSGFYHILIQYLNNLSNYKGLKILVYKDSESGILSLIDHLCTHGVLNRDDLVYLEDSICYQFESITYIQNDHHVFNGSLLPMMDTFIYRYILPHISIPYIPNICVTTNLTANGVFLNDDVNTFCDKWKFTQLKTFREEELISYIHQCEIFVVSYGSAFFKNFVYISERCKQIIVLVNGDVYTNDYYNLSRTDPTKYQGILFKKYKNAEIKYIITKKLSLMYTDNV